MAETQEISLKDGGVIVVLLGDNHDNEVDDDYRLNPMVHVVDARGLGTGDIDKCLPSNTKALVMTKDIPQNLYHRLKSELDRRKIVYVYRNGRAAIDDELRKHLKMTPRPIALVPPADGKKKIAPHGAVMQLIRESNLDYSKSTADEARRLFSVAQLQGIPSTFGSIAQAISKYKRTAGRGEIPQSVVGKDKSERLKAIEVLDQCMNMMTTLHGKLKTIYDFVEKTERVNETLTARLAMMRESFEQIEKISAD
jgi:hypothetical protein